MLGPYELVDRSRQSNSLDDSGACAEPQLFSQCHITWLRSHVMLSSFCRITLVPKWVSMDLHFLCSEHFQMILSVKIWLLFWTLGTFGVRDPFSAAPCHDFLSNAHSRWLETSWTSAESIWWVPTTSTNPGWFWKLLCNSYLSFPWHAFILSDVNLGQKTAVKKLQGHSKQAELQGLTAMNVLCK